MTEKVFEGASFDSAMYISDLCAGYGASQVLHEVSLSVQPGEIVAILGPNGAGKTTMAKAICGLIRPTAGSVRVGRSELAGLRADQALRKGLVMVPEGRQLLTGLTVEENLLLAGATSPDVSSRLAEVLDYFPTIKDKLSNWGSELSGGQQQLVAIGRALMSSPHFIVLDEPSLGLAPKTQGDVAEVINEIRRTDGTGLILVEQNLGLAARLADRALIMRRGSLHEELQGADLKDPKRLFATYVE